MIDVQHGPSGPKGPFACCIPKLSWTTDSIGVQMVVDARLQQGCLGRGLVQCHCFLHPVCSGIQSVRDPLVMYAAACTSAVVE